MSADPNRLERRAAYRFEVHVPLAIQFEGRTMHGFTQNLSGRGLFFYSEMAIPEGSVLELTLTMPSEVTLGESMPVRCRGRALRTSSPGGELRKGIAVQFDSYEYLPEDERETISQFVRVCTATGASPNPIQR